MAPRLVTCYDICNMEDALEDETLPSFRPAAGLTTLNSVQICSTCLVLVIAYMLVWAPLEGTMRACKHSLSTRNAHQHEAGGSPPAR